MILYLVCIFLLLAYCLLMLCYSFGWWRQKWTESRALSTEKVSVLIPARNEAKNITACIRSILDNNFPQEQLEILVIDDYSTDDTALLAQAALKNHGRVIRLAELLAPEEQLNAYKKKALELAIAQASGTWIVTTDADCIVAPDWLRQLISTEEQIQLVAAPVNFIPNKGKRNWLYYFQSLDFMTMQGITAASHRLGLGNMCNGANLAFRKKAFEQVGGYKGIDHIASGDDMLLMSKIHQLFPQGIAYIKSTKAIVDTPVQASWSDFLNQRIRWSSKADKYQEKKLTLILALVYCFNFSFLPLLLAGFFNGRYWEWALIALLVKIIVEIIFLLPVANFYNKTKELFLFPILQPLHIVYIICAGFLGKFGTYHWKDRKVH